MADVLIVEDEETDRVILEKIVEGLGHEVHVASNGVQALNLQFGTRIDVVITDLHMPHVDGLELIRALRASFSDAVIIAVSGSGPDLLAAVRRMGVFAVLTKPVDHDELVEVLKEALHMDRSHLPEEASAEHREQWWAND